MNQPLHFPLRAPERDLRTRRTWAANFGPAYAQLGVLLDHSLVTVCFLGDCLIGHAAARYLLIRRYPKRSQGRSRWSIASATGWSVVQFHTERGGLVRRGGSQGGSRAGGHRPLACKDS